MEKLKRLRPIIVGVVVLVAGFLIYLLAKVIVSHSYSSSEYVMGRQGNTTNLPKVSTTEIDIGSVDVEDIEKSDLQAVIDECKEVAENDGLSFQEKARQVKECNQAGEGEEYLTDSEGFSMPTGANGNPYYLGSDEEVFVQSSYDYLRTEGVVDSNISEYSYGLGKYDRNYVLYLKGNTDWIVLSDLVGYPKVFCKYEDFTETEKSYFEGKGFEYFVKDSLYIYSY